MRYWAAVGNDGFRPVIWGVGKTEDEARDDAENWLGQAQALRDLESLEYHEISEAQYATIKAGDVSWPVE